MTLMIVNVNWELLLNYDISLIVSWDYLFIGSLKTESNILWLQYILLKVIPKRYWFPRTNGRSTKQHLYPLFHNYLPLSECVHYHVWLRSLLYPYNSGTIFIIPCKKQISTQYQTSIFKKSCRVASVQKSQGQRP